MKLGGEGYSPGLLKKIEYAGGNHRSFEVASDSLAKLAEFEISAKHVERLTERLGRERAGLRDAAALAMEKRLLRSKYKQAPAMAVISIDAGKAQFRAEDKGPGVHNARWGDTKVACLQTYSDIEHTSDPQPEPPEAFLNPKRVEQLCREMEHVRGTGEVKSSKDKLPQDQAQDDKSKKKKKKKKSKRNRAKRLVRTVVATTQKVEPFGWMVSAEAMSRKMYAAKKRAIVGDGGNWVDPLAQLHFPDWIQILDFLHLLVHLFAAARMAHIGDAKASWTLYEKMLRDAWAGRATEVINTLQSQLKELKNKNAKAHEVVELAMNYVDRNQHRMDYPHYRQLGLPVGSALVESLIKQINHRVKGTEQFWNNGGLEAILQVRAAYLSHDDRAEKHHEHRPRGSAIGSNRAQKRSKSGKFQLVG